MDTQLGYWRWKLFRWNDHPNPYRNRPDDALNWLRQYQTNAIAMAEFTDLLRNSVTGGYISGDPQLILRQLADKMSTGEIQVCVELCGPSTLMAWSGDGEAEPDLTDADESSSPAAAPASDSPPPAAASADDDESPEPTLAGTTDPAAMAQALKDAAEKGTPFCEECAKAAAEQLVSPSPEPEVDIDPATAAILKEAAQDGVPFCEECVKAAAAEAAEQELVAQ
jgi:hypothetical protein